MGELRRWRKCSSLQIIRAKFFRIHLGTKFLSFDMKLLSFQSHFCIFISLAIFLRYSFWRRFTPKLNSEIRFAISFAVNGELSSYWLNWFDKPASDWPKCIDKPITHYDTWFSRFDDGRETAVETVESQNKDCHSDTESSVWNETWYSFYVFLSWYSRWKK